MIVALGSARMHNHSPTSRVTEAQMESPNKARVEAELRALRDKNRLAYHTTEDYNYLYPDIEKPKHKNAEYYHTYGTLPTLHYLRANDALSDQAFAAQIEALQPFRGQDLPLFSMTLLPPNMPVYPYDVTPDTLGPCGYLFSLDEHANGRAARVVGRMPNYMASGGMFEKLVVDRKLLTGDWQARTEVLLKTLAEEYREDSARPEKLNEILVAGGLQNIAAIAISLRYNPQEVSVDTYMKCAQLRGALEGLTHLRLGVDAPVVYYHTSGKSAGTCTYLAQGRQELLSKALEIVEQIDTDMKLRSYILDSHVDEYKDIQYKMMTELGLDARKPIHEQQQVIQALKSEQASLSKGSSAGRA